MFHIRKYFGKLNKKQTEEIGTLKSPTKPLYLAKQKKEELITKKKELENYNNYKYEIEEEIKNKQKELINEEELLKALQEMNETENAKILENEKINIQISSENELIKNKKEIEEEISKIKPIEDMGKKHNLLYLIPFFIIIISVYLATLGENTLGMAGIGISAFIFAIILINNMKKTNKYKKNKEKIKEEKQNLETKIELIEKEIKNKQKIIEEAKNNIEKEIKNKQEYIRLKYPNVNKIVFDSVENGINLTHEQNYINELKLILNEKNSEKKQITEKLEDLVQTEEKLNQVEEILQELEEYNEAIEIAKETLESAYLEMKESITPRFTENLSKSINKITGGRYKTVKINEENDLALEAENGAYVNANILSQGTIDELYLSLRISSINELTKETMPIILDETFAYFDEKRLENVLKFFKDNYQDRQIIVLTCTDREIRALERINISYNKIILN